MVHVIADSVIVTVTNSNIWMNTSLQEMITVGNIQAFEYIITQMIIHNWYGLFQYIYNFVCINRFICE